MKGIRLAPHPPAPPLAAGPKSAACRQKCQESQGPGDFLQPTYPSSPFCIKGNP